EIGVWDTEYNSGVLLYLNLCEHKVEIVIDRGIKDATTQQVWDEICQNIIQHLVQQQFKEGVIAGVKQIGQILDQYYDRKIDVIKQGFSMDHITELFCILDDFCKKFNESLEKALISDQKTRLKKSALSLSEAMTIVILFHQSGFRFFKYFYCQMIVPFWKSAF